MAEGDVITDRSPLPPQLYPWTAPGECRDTSPSTPPGWDRGDRVLVVAVGSNASPDVLRRKLGGQDIPAVVPVRVHGIAVGHSAHVSRRGYIAAAPWHSPGSIISTTAAWLDSSQLADLDATEPNYRRITLSNNEFPVELTDIGDKPATFDIYDSVHGLLPDRSSGAPRAFVGQQVLFDELAAASSDTAWCGPAAEVCDRLADPATARRITHQMRSNACTSGLDAVTSRREPALQRS